MHEDCPAGDDMAMSCCSTGSGPEHDAKLAVVKSGVDVPALVHGPLGAFTVVPTLPVRVLAVAARAFESATLKLPHRPPYLVLSTLLV
jgi:hypothetical protein